MPRLAGATENVGKGAQSSRTEALVVRTNRFACDVVAARTALPSSNCKHGSGAMQHTYKAKSTKAI